ncbi:unnamed protein product [Cyclocybe aegerita]|uniref:Uncharacterized protein n=1 Tax=Cyclocybe aegerita TaxID=1973307 RepID=A0A8S0W155_CYCAE|nr:unnamed protein product [Cyclocybe aegerita]
MTTALRRVIVDDVDPSIEYTGSWNTVSGLPLDNVGNFGPTYRTTLHSLRGASGSFAFRFDGTGNGLIQGSNNVVTTDGVTDPTWECFVDGQQLILDNPFRFPENSWTFCNWEDLASGPHVVALNVTSRNAAFYLDRIQYTPTIDTTPPNQARSLSTQDPALNYDSNWSFANGLGMVSRGPGATFTLAYVGAIHTLLINMKHADRPLNIQDPLWTFGDDEGPVSFNIPNGTLDRAPSMYNQRYFTSPKRAIGSHTVTVKYIGTGDPSTRCPLIISSMVVNNDEGGSPPSSSTSAPSSTATIVPSNTPSIPGSNVPATSNTQNTVANDTGGGVKAGTIVGAVLGSLAALLIVILTVWYLLRRRRQPSRPTEPGESYIQPFTEGIPPGPTIYHPPPMLQRPRKGTPVFDASASNSLSNPSNQAPSSPPRPSLPRNGRLIPMDASLHPPAPPESTVSSNSGGSSSQSSQRPLVQPKEVVHQDSGIRLNQNGEPIVGHPPTYTAG